MTKTRWTNRHSVADHPVSGRGGMGTLKEFKERLNAVVRERNLMAAGRIRPEIRPRRVG